MVYVNKSGYLSTYVNHVKRVDMDADEIRKQNLELIIDELFGGVAARLAEAMDVEKGQISRVRADSTAKTKREITGRFARRIEDSVGLVKGWMDAPHTRKDLKKLAEPIEKDHALIALKIAISEVEQFAARQKIIFTPDQKSDLILRIVKYIEKIGDFEK